MNIGFTGHRPNKLGGYNWNTEKNIKLMNVLKSTIGSILKNKLKSNFHFITGGALGLDQMAFSIVYELSVLTNHSISIEVAIPFKDQPNKWINSIDKARYTMQLDKADKVTYVDTIKYYQRTNTPIGKYTPQKLQIRNEYIVDNSDILIAVWDGSNSGTGNCVRYAKKLNKDIIIINPNKL